MVLRVLALDPATLCGWAYRSASGSVSSGTWDLSTKRDESTGMKLLRFEAKINEIAYSGIDLIVFEAARNAMPKMQGALVHQAKLQSIIERWAEVNSTTTQCRGYSPSEIKKFATGKGNAGKPEVMKAARERFGFTDGDDNEADALCLLHLAIAEYGSLGGGTV